MTCRLIRKPSCLWSAKWLLGEQLIYVVECPLRSVDGCGNLRRNRSASHLDRNRLRGDFNKVFQVYRFVSHLLSNLSHEESAFHDEFVSCKELQTIFAGSRKGNPLHCYHKSKYSPTVL